MPRSIDELFAFQAPSALFRGNSDRGAAGSTRCAQTLFNKKTGEAQGGINAGVIVLHMLGASRGQVANRFAALDCIKSLWSYFSDLLSVITGF